MTSTERKGPLRHGYTTGACAAAAARAAALALDSGKAIAEVQVTLPAGQSVTFKIASCRMAGGTATASVIKDAGDDPDVTNGAEIVAEISRTSSPGININGGEGVGRVTRPGLGLAIGGPAINPVPARMISRALASLAESSPNGLRVTISVPGGEKLAQRTLNPRLGIIGGISILGTTGLVVPFSHDAYKTSISLAMDVAVASGCREVALCTGGRSEKFAQGVLPLPEVCFVQMADYAGFSLQECLKRPIAVAHICAFIGKLSKIASGNFSTHVRDGELSRDFLPSLADRAGVSEETALEMKDANTARHFMEIAQSGNAEAVFSDLCRLARRMCREFTGERIGIDCLLFDFEGRLLARADSNG